MKTCLWLLCAITVLSAPGPESLHRSGTRGAGRLDGLKYFEFEINALNRSWDLFLPKPYRKGLRGTLNAPTTAIAAGRSNWSSHGWHSLHAAERDVHRPEAEWRINFSRVEWNKNLPVRFD